MIRNFKRNRYLLAFFFTIAIFVIGLMLGVIMGVERTSYLEDLAKEQNADYESLQLQYLYLSTATQNESCNAFAKTLEQSLKDLEDNRKKVELYISQSKFVNYIDYDIIKRNYILSEVRYWLLSKQTDKLCNDSALSILYFYSNEEGQCRDCNSQGLILTYIKKTFNEDVLIFSVDGEFTKEPMVEIIKEAYNITEYPTIIIKGDVHKGLVTKEELFNEICKNHPVSNEKCILEVPIES